MNNMFPATKAVMETCRAYAARGRVVAFDTETTGISHADEIVQIGAVEYVDGRRARTLNLYLAPTCAMSPGAEAVNHLSADFLAANGLPPAEALARFFAFLGTGALLVAHNLPFDYRMLRNECRKFGVALSLDGVSFCDTLALARKLVPGLPHYRLSALIPAFGLEAENSHDALDDTLACGALFFYLERLIPVPGDFTYAPFED